MLRLLLVALCALSLTAGLARAEGAAACPSIAARDCPPLSRVTAKGDLRVEVFARKRSVSFPLAAAGQDLREEFAASCPDGRCACDETVQYFEFKGPVPGFRQVNAAEHAAAQKAKCSIENSNVIREARRFASSGALVSTAVFELEYCRTCGGTCHGRTALMTYDGQTGALLSLRDVLKADAVPALRAHMAAYVARTYVEEDASEPLRGREFAQVRIAAHLAERKLVDEGFYVENGAVFADVDVFASSCADGSFFPVPIPAAMINPAFAALLQPRQ